MADLVNTPNVAGVTSSQSMANLDSLTATQVTTIKAITGYVPNSIVIGNINQVYNGTAVIYSRQINYTVYQ